MTLPMPRGGRRRELVFVAILSVLFVAAIHQSWGMWLDPVADTGRDLYIPEQIAEGGFKLYRDVSYLYPPVAPYLLAAVVFVFGSNLAVMTAVGLTTSLLITLMLYLVGRRWAGPTGGAILALLFISVHMTGISGYSFNFIFPYAHGATIGFLLLLLFLYSLTRYAVDRGDVHWLTIALLAGSVAGWSKIEYAATFLLVLIASFLVRLPSIKPIALAAGGNFALLGFLSWYFSDAPPERHWLTMNVLPQSLLSGSVARNFYDRIRGLDQPVENLKLAVTGALLIGGVLLCLAAIERLKSEGVGRLIAITLLVAASVALQVGLAQHFLFFRGWFLIQWLLIPIAVQHRRSSPLLLLLVFSLLLGSRILIRLEPTWYGFLFAIPAEIVFIYVLFEELPRRRLYGRGLALVWVPMFILIGVSSLLNQRTVYESRRENVVVTPRGTYTDSLADRAKMSNELFRFLERREPTSMVVVPEGLAYNWLAGIKSSIPYHTFSPAELPDRRSQQTVIESLEQSPPELLLLIRRDYSEFGYVGIGVDYGHELILRIQCLYDAAVYRESERFFLVVMERTAKADCP